MKISVLWVGHKLETFEQSWIEVFEKRLGRYVKSESIRMAPKKTSNEDLLKKLNELASGNSVVVLLDEGGKPWTTQEFKTWIDKQEIQSKSSICFVIGDSYGFSDVIKKKFPTHISLSKFTLPHKLALLIFFEQLYRVYSIKAGSPYHHE